MLHNDELNINLLLLVAVATFAPGLGLFPSPWTWIHWRGQSLRPWTDEELPGILCSLSPARSDSLSHYHCPPRTSVSSSSSSHCRRDVDLRLPAWKQRNYESQGRLWEQLHSPFPSVGNINQRILVEFRRPNLNITMAKLIKYIPRLCQLYTCSN